MSLTKIFSLLYFITEKLQNIKKLGNRMNEYCWNSIDMGELNKKKENGKLFEISVNFFVRFCNIFSIPQFALWKCLLWRKKRTRMKYEQKKNFGTNLDENNPNNVHNMIRFMLYILLLMKFMQIFRFPERALALRQKLFFRSYVLHLHTLRASMYVYIITR